MLVANGGIERDPKSRLQEWFKLTGRRSPLTRCFITGARARQAFHGFRGCEFGAVDRRQHYDKGVGKKQSVRRPGALHQLEASGGVEEDEASP